MLSLPDWLCAGTLVFLCLWTQIQVRVCTIVSSGSEAPGLGLELHRQLSGASGLSTVGLGHFGLRDQVGQLLILFSFSLSLYSSLPPSLPPSLPISVSISLSNLNISDGFYCSLNSERIHSFLTSWQRYLTSAFDEA